MSELPDWYTALTAKPAAERDNVVQPGAAGDGEAVVIANPSAYVDAVLERECREVQETGEGGRNHRLNAAAFAVARIIAGGLPLEEDRAVEQLTAAADNAGLDAGETAKTIRSGLKGGARHPLAWTEPAPAPMAVPFDAPAGLVAVGGDGGLDVAVAAEAHRQRVTRAARRMIDAEEAARSYAKPAAVGLGEFLAQPDPPVTWTLEGLLQRGHNALITAAFKAGKTTLVNELARSIADGEPYLGKFAIGADLGRVALFNYEVDSAQYRRWLREVGIANADRVVVVNLRGLRAPLGVDSVMEDVIGILRDNDVGIWVVDPFARAFTGGNENDNAEVGVFLDRLDIVKAEAGVHSLVMPVHTGRASFDIGQERARGATRLDDWTDVRWLYNVDDDGVRYFAATGRDVDVPEEAVRYDDKTRRLIMGGPDRRIAKSRGIEEDVIDFLTVNPGANARALRTGVTGNNGTIDSVIASLIGRHIIRCEKATARGKADAYFLGAAPFMGGVPE